MQSTVKDFLYRTETSRPNLSVAVQQPAEVAVARELPANTVLWFVVSGLLVTATALAIAFGWYGTFAHMCVTATLALSACFSFAVGSSVWPSQVGSEYSSEDPYYVSDWNEVAQTLNSALLFVVSGVFLGGAIAGIAFGAVAAACVSLCCVAGSWTAAYGVWSNVR